ncbi:MAG: arginine--tRNA ligase [Clostridia bacterium]|nr:arginine--tRNA ligase [Clostridia bacterium]NCC74836.1 arginine--tRNA ligase [Clostridia bacterium]
MNFRQAIIDGLAPLTQLPAQAIGDLLEIPPQPQLGDYAFPCFSLAKTLRKAPAAIATDLAGQLGQSLTFVDRIETSGGYLNFFIDRATLVSQTVRDTLDAGDQLGVSNMGHGQTILVEFSSPNIAKPFHVGHAFTTILGNALAKFYQHLGYTTVRMNHLGDYGTQFGKLIVAYQLWGNEAALNEHPIQELLRIYVKFHDEAKEHPELETQARDHFRRLETGEPEQVALWQRFRDLSLVEFERVYQRLGVTFDNYNGESFYSDQIPAVVDWLKEKNLIEDSEGAQVVRLDEKNLPPCIVLKSDGTTIYASRDIAAVLYRDRTYHFAKNIYVVGTPQALHFRQVFAVLEKAGFEKSSDCFHVGFGLVKFPDRKLSTRSGDVILLEDLLAESVDKTLEIIQKNAALRHPDMTDRDMQEIAEKIGIGAVVFTFLKNSRERDIVFSWEEMLDFEGDSAPYVLYTYARARSILRKAGQEGISYRSCPDTSLRLLASDDEFALAKLLESFGPTLEKAVSVHEPFMLVRLITNLARVFNKYYHHEPILKTQDPDLRAARLALVEAVSIGIRTGLDLLGISAVERM